MDAGLASLAEAGSEVIGNLVLEIQRSLDYFESALSQPPLGALYIYPGTGELDELIESLQSGLAQVECRPLTLGDLVGIGEDPPHRGATLLHALGAGLRDQHGAVGA